MPHIEPRKIMQFKLIAQTDVGEHKENKDPHEVAVIMCVIIRPLAFAALSNRPQQRLIVGEQEKKLALFSGHRSEPSNDTEQRALAFQIACLLILWPKSARSE